MKQVEKSWGVDRIGAIIESQRNRVHAFYLRAVAHQPLIAWVKEQVKHDAGSQAKDQECDAEPNPVRRVLERKGIKQHQAGIGYAE
jgi:hypothetical protein